MNGEHDGSTAVMRAVNLSGGYGRRTVVRGVSFDLGRGELLAVVGPNGAGKSTLLKLLSGALAPHDGSVELMGLPQNGYERRSLARILAMVAQENSVAFSFTVLETVLMGRAPHLGPFHLESPHDLAIARQALARFGLAELARRPINELSGGERKCVFLARALTQQPRVALLDEPTAFLDMRHVAEIFDCFRELRAENGMAVVTTLHDLNAAAMYADRVLLLRNGAAVACGTPADVLTAENLQTVYETRIYVARNPVTGTVMVLPGGAIPAS